MKKVWIFLFTVLMMSFVMLTQVEARPGGLPDMTVDQNISDCPNCTVTIALNVEFDTAKAIVREKYHNEIKKVADFMKQYPNTTAVIEGHTDNVGTADYNKKLSEERVKSVRQYLINKFGIKASRLSAVGYGLTKPVASNSTEEGRQKNRRVEAVIKTIAKK